jgi:hypothetical protein
MTEPIDTMEHRVIAFVARETGVAATKISATTELGRHCGLDGEDAKIFVEKFQAEFEVDMQDFQFSRHFGPELPFNVIWYVHALMFARHKLKLEPVTISDLAVAAQQRRWAKE